MRPGQLATAAGLAKQALAQKEWRRAQQAFNAQLGDERVCRLHAVIDECLALMHEDPASAE